MIIKFICTGRGHYEARIPGYLLKVETDATRPSALLFTATVRKCASRLCFGGPIVTIKRDITTSIGARNWLKRWVQEHGTTTNA